MSYKINHAMMKSIAEIIESIDKLEFNKGQKTLSTLEYIYFIYIISPFNFLRFSEEYRIAKDLVRIQQALEVGTVINVKIKSKLLSDNRDLQKYKKIVALDDGEIEAIRKLIVLRYNHIIKAVFFAEVIIREKKEEWFRYSVTTFLALISILLAFDKFF